MNVDPPHHPLDQRSFDALAAHINPLEICGDFGIQFYINCVGFVQSEIFSHNIM